MRLITLYIAAGTDSWYADFHGDTDVMKAFGTDQIPTAFLARARYDVVQREIASLNPDAEVIVDVLSRYARRDGGR